MVGDQPPSPESFGVPGRSERPEPQRSEPQKSDKNGEHLLRLEDRESDACSFRRAIRRKAKMRMEYIP